MAGSSKRASVLAIIGPGLIVAATGVGAGDLATAGFAGSKLGYAVLWAILVGAAFKFVLSEGLTRWQLATGSTILEGAMRHLGLAARLIFIVYLLLFTFVVGRALMSACGVTAHAILPLTGSPKNDIAIYGIAHSIAALVIVRLAGFAAFERIMATRIAVMFGTVVLAAVLIGPDWGGVVRGLFVPTIPQLRDGGLTWTIAVTGGVGGTLTIICYSYWIRQQGRESPGAMWTCRIDLAVGYAVTALFGIAMMILASGMELAGGGSQLVVNLAAILGERLGEPVKWVFLIGAWATVFSSVLGVWQAIPFVFADWWRITRAPKMIDVAPSAVNTKSRPYVIYQLAIATIPAIGLFATFKEAQKAYTIVGACFLPLLALVLLILCGRASLIGPGWRNRAASTIALVVILVFFVAAAVYEVTGKIGGG